MKIYLIRHGQTDWNLAGEIQGSTDISLNEAGLCQAQRLAAGMSNRPVTQIFSSTLNRAMITAEAIGKQQQVGVEPMELLKEVNFGYWEGLTWEEIQIQYPKEYKLWCINPIEVSPPGGELQEDIRQRCKQAVEIILTQAKGDVAIVSHGATLLYLVDYMMREHPLENEIIVNNASVTTIEYSPLTQDFVLTQMNDISHL